MVLELESQQPQLLSPKKAVSDERSASMYQCCPTNILHSLVQKSFVSITRTAVQKLICTVKIFALCFGCCITTCYDVL